jgi:hypothetical protein
LLYDYDARGNVARVRGFGASQNGVETSYTFDSLNRLATVYDYSTLAATYDVSGEGATSS